MMLERFSKAMLSLHARGGALAIEEFQTWALKEIQAILPFDSAVWAHEILAGKSTTPHSSYTLNLPDSFMETWAQFKHQDHTIEQVASQSGTTINCNVRKEYAGKDIFEFHCKPAQMEHLLCTADIDPHSGLYNLISLYRSNPGQPFSEQERQLKQALFPHLVASYFQNQISNFEKLKSPHTSNNWAIASVDAGGIFHIMDPKMARILAQEWPEWRENGTLPHALLALLDGEQNRLMAKDHVFCVSPLADRFQIHARERNQLDILSKRELEICQLIRAGMTHKEIAKNLAIAPATVRNHLSTIYQKLGTRNKTELASKFIE